MNVIPSNAESKEPTEGKPVVRISRAGFLSVAGKSLLALCGLLGLGGLVEFMSFQPDPAPPNQYDLGDARDYPLGSHTLVAEGRAVLLHGESGFSALSLVCPHLGCTLALDQDGYACPCHGSRFNPDGSVRNGPANQTMQKLRVEETPDGRLILKVSTL